MATIIADVCIMYKHWLLLKCPYHQDTCSSVWNNRSAEYHRCHQSFAPVVTPTWQIDRTTFQPNIPTWFFNLASGHWYEDTCINRSLNKSSPPKILSRLQSSSLIGSFKFQGSLVTKLPISFSVCGWSSVPID